MARDDHLLVSVLLSIGRADPNAEDHQCSIEGKALNPVISTKDSRMRTLLFLHGAKIDLGDAALVQGRGEYDDPTQELRESPEEVFDMNHSKRSGVGRDLIMNTSAINRGEVLAWLSKLEPEDDLERIYRKRHGSTGQWFLDSEDVQDWVEKQEICLLWCYGNR